MPEKFVRAAKQGATVPPAAAAPPATKTSNPQVASNQGNLNSIATAARFSKGDAVDARFLAQSVGVRSSSWFNGKVAKVTRCSNGDWAYDIKYEDGDFEACVPEKFVRAAKQGTTAQPAAAVLLATKALNLASITHASCAMRRTCSCEANVHAPTQHALCSMRYAACAVQHAFRTSHALRVLPMRPCAAPMRCAMRCC